MPPSLLQPISINSNSNSNTQLEVSKLESKLFNNLNLDEESNALLSTETSALSSP